FLLLDLPGHLQRFRRREGLAARVLVALGRPAGVARLTKRLPARSRRPPRLTHFARSARWPRESPKSGRKILRSDADLENVSLCRFSPCPRELHEWPRVLLSPIPSSESVAKRRPDDSVSMKTLSRRLVCVAR